MKNILKLLAIAAIGSCMVTHANAVAITLFNTGVDGAGAVLPDGTIGDPHYSLIASPAAYPIRIKSSASGFPVVGGLWIGDNSTSRWIGPGPAGNTTLTGAYGLYKYRTTFDLTGLDFLSASITGQWAADDSGQIFLNGAPLTASAGYVSWSPFSALSGFTAGINTLDFVVNNSGGGPTGLRVEMTGTANRNSVPDGGSSIALLGLALTAVAGARRKFGI